MMPSLRFARFVWGVLAWNLVVILWGGYVRASGSGAGCGSHWPLCNGDVLPLAGEVKTLVEFGHRVTSGLALVLVVVAYVWSRRLFPRGALARRAAFLSVVFMVTEALIGAGLVLFKWVAHDDSLGRALALPAHLINTFVLLACITLTAWWAGGGAPARADRRDPAAWLLGAGLAMAALIGVSGAVAALGATLFPADSLREGLRQDFSPAAHFLVRLRFLHPVFAVGGGLGLLTLAGWLGGARPSGATPMLSRTLAALVLTQLVAGFTNLILHAPVWLQLVHLLLADLVWITLVLLAAAALAVPAIAGERDVEPALAAPAVAGR